MARLPRDAPLPSLSRPRVVDAVTQRALDNLVTALEGVLKLLAPFAQQEMWQRVSFNAQSDWTSSSSGSDVLRFRKDPLGTVSLRGWASSAAGTNNVIAVLPPGYRPSTRLRLPASRFTGGAYSLTQLDVDVDGRVLIASPAMPAAAIEVFLDHVRFEADR